MNQIGWRAGAARIGAAAGLLLCAACATPPTEPPRAEPPPAEPPPAEPPPIVRSHQTTAPPPRLASTPPMMVQGAAPPPLRPEPALATGPANLEIVRYIGVDRSRWPTSGGPANLADLYTRLQVETDANTSGAGGAGATRSYRLERRSALARVFSSRTITIAALAKMEVRDPDVEASVPLFAISHTSARGTGEAFVTSFTASHVQNPLFRIGPNTTLTVRLSSKVSDQQKPDVTAALVSAVQTAVSIAAPTSSILTTLSGPDVAKSAKAIDSTLGGLMSQDLSEDLELGRLVDTWREGATVQVQGLAPFGLLKAEGDDSPEARREHPDKAIGTWRITLSCPRPSVFDARDLCGDGGFDLARLPMLKAQVLQAVSPSQVLQTNLSSQVTVQAFIQSQGWYTGYLQKTSKTAADTRSFCASALTGLYGAGLNRFDSALVLWAVGRQMPGFVELDAATGVAGACQALVPAEVTL